MKSYILDENKQPVPYDWNDPKILPFYTDFETNMRVGLTHIGPGYVSTVFLRFDHSFGTGLPVLWETMVFGTGLEEFDSYVCERYTSHADAVEGHKAMVKRVSDAYRDTP